MISELVAPFSDFSEEEKITNGMETHISITKEVNSGHKYFSKFFTSLTDSNWVSFLKEAEIFHKLNHGSIAHLQKICFNNKNSAALHFNFIPSENLNDLISSSSTAINNPTILMKIIYGTASALFYLHQHNYCLTNFNTSSVMLNDDFEPILFDISQIKAIDPVSRSIDPSGIKKFPENVLFVAPELLSNSSNISIFPEITEKVDIYSFGMFVFHLLSGSLVNEITDETDLLNHIIFGGRPEFPPNFPPVFEELVIMCWDIESQARPSFKDIIETLSMDNFALPGTDLAQYHAYIQKMQVKEEKDEATAYYEKVIQDKDTELEAASQLCDFLKTTLEETTKNYQKDFERLTKEVEETKKLIPSPPQYRNIATITDNFNNNRIKEYLFIGSCSAAFALTFSCLFFFFKKKK